MAFLKVDKEAISRKNLDGIVYILIMVVDGNEVYKIGVTSRDKVEDRVVEILLSHNSQYRFFCYCKPKRFRKTTNIYEKERLLHEVFKQYKYESEKKFQGCTELFAIDDEDLLLKVYEMVLDDKPVEGVLNGIFEKGG